MRSVLLGLLTLSLVATPSLAQNEFPPEKDIFKRIDVALSGRLRHLTLERVFDDGSQTIVVMEREGGYPDWTHRLSLWSADLRSGKAQRRAAIQLPSDSLLYGFVSFPGKASSALVLVRAASTELWFSGENGWQASDVHRLKTDGVFWIPDRSGPVPFLPRSPRPAEKGTAQFVIPVRAGIANAVADAKGLRLTETFPILPRAFYRSGLQSQPLDLPFWVRGSLWFPSPVSGSLLGPSHPQAIFPWMDEATVISLSGDPSPKNLFFHQMTDAERDDDQSYVVTLPEDLNGDGRTDFIVNKFQGVATELRADTTLFMTGPDGTVPQNGLRLKPQGNRAAGAIAVDFNRDGKMDLGVASAQFNAWAIVRALVQRQVNITFSFYLNHNGSYRLDRPDFDREISFGFDLSDAQIEGILPTMDGDFNGDGYPDALYARNRKVLTVLLQRPRAERPFESVPSGEYSITVPRLLTVGDLDGNGKSDVVLYDRRSSGNKRVAVLLNTGKL